MGAFTEYVHNIRNASVSIFEGMAVTLSWMFRKPMTIQYPDRTERPIQDMLPERFRGILEVNTSACTACGACARACPIDVILIDVEKVPATKSRYLTRFDIDAAKCMYCGLCTEASPTGCLRHTPEFEAVNRDIRNLVLHFVDEPVVPYKAKKSAPPPEFPPPGERARKTLQAWNATYTPWSPKPPPAPPPEADEATSLPKSAAETGTAEERSDSEGVAGTPGEAPVKADAHAGGRPDTPASESKKKN